MQTRSEIREFLTSRRAKITPDQAGLTAYGPRRVPGLRREEVAVLAGVSVPYYTRLERGDLSGVSEGVLDALARTLPSSSQRGRRRQVLDAVRAAAEELHNTPTICRRTPAGLESGPSRLKMVRVPSSTRVGPTFFIAG